MNLDSFRADIVLVQKLHMIGPNRHSNIKFWSFWYSVQWQCQSFRLEYLLIVGGGLDGSSYRIPQIEYFTLTSTYQQGGSLPNCIRNSTPLVELDTYQMGAHYISSKQGVFGMDLHWK